MRKLNNKELRFRKIAGGKIKELIYKNGLNLWAVKEILNFDGGILTKNTFPRRIYAIKVLEFLIPETVNIIMNTLELPKIKPSKKEIDVFFNNLESRTGKMTKYNISNLKRFEYKYKRDEEYRKIFGSRLRELRRESMYTTRTIGKALSKVGIVGEKCPWTTISFWENGQSFPKHFTALNYLNMAYGNVFNILFETCENGSIKLTMTEKKDILKTIKELNNNGFSKVNYKVKNED